MSRLYRTVRFILRRGVEVYFVDIQASGKELIPEEGPLILAANHPNSIMDTVMLGTQTRREIRYMARSGLFKNLAVRAIFNKFGVIPIYRAQDGTDITKNMGSFEAAYEALEDGTCIGIFPEGQNSGERRVLEIKTGTARIGLEAEARNSFRLGVKIQPVGLNFEDRDRFLSRVLVRFGEPIELAEYAEEYAEDPRATVRRLTDRLQEEMRRLATHIEDERNHDLVRDIYSIYGSGPEGAVMGDQELAIELFDRRGRQEGLDEKSVAGGLDRFSKEQELAQVVEYYQAQDPGRVARLRMDIRRYKDHLGQLKIRHKLLDKGVEDVRRRKEAIKLTAFALLLGPLAVFGLINHLLPALIVRLVVKRQPDEAFVAFAGFLTGLLAFPFFYALQGWLLYSKLGVPAWAVALYILVLPTSGLFFLRWWQKILVYRQRILARTLFRSDANLLQAAELERRAIIESFEEFEKGYRLSRYREKESEGRESEVVV